ncbi:MAG: bacterial Ig-like domain-containing protein, partial [Candidatus Ornithomonoglobus sp.]
KPYAVYWRGYYNHDNGRTGVAGVSFDGARLSVDYIFDTRSDQPGYTAGNEKYAGEGNHNLTVADVDKDGRDEIISGAMCMEINEDNKLMPKWCTFLGHGDALHIGDYDPTHDGYEFFTVHEEGGVESEGITLDFGMSVIDAETGEIMFHQSNTKDTGRGMMANVGSGGYYQITGIGTYQSNGGTDFTPVNNGMGNNFRIFWDGDLYDELLNSTEITSWNGRTMAAVFNAVGCVSINSTKANPSLQADILGDWREEVIYPLTDSSALRVFTTTDHTDYKMKSLMYDRVYRSGVAAEQTAYNQPPHIGYYLSEDCFYGTLTALEINTDNAKTEYHVGEALDISGLSVTAQYSDAEEREVTNYAVSGYDPMIAGGQQITVTYLGMSESYSVSVTAEQDIEVKCENSTLYAGTEFTKDMLNVTMLYKNGDAVRVKDFSVSEVDTLSTGSRTVTITHKGVQGIYRKDIELNIITDITADKNGMVTGYTGENEEVTIPSSMTIDASYRIKSIEGNLISLEMADTVPDVYAAAYDQTGRLEKVKLFRLDGSGRVTLDAGFEADKVFIWDGMKPTENDGAVTVEISSIEDGALKDSRIKKLYIYNDELEFKGDDIFPEGIVIVCHESSTAYEYAAAHNIETELIKEGDKITFDEDFYQAYSGSGILMQTMNAAYLAADHVTYNTHAADSRAPWYTANTYGFKLASENGDNYLYVNAGIYDQNNQFNQIYITLNEPKQISEKQTVSFDIKLPSNSGSPYVEMQNAEGTVIDTISANAAGLSNDVWYRYEMEYDGSGYTRRIYNEDGSVKSETALSAAASGTVLSHIVFKQDFTMGSGSIKTGLVYVDNIILN